MNINNTPPVTTISAAYTSSASSIRQTLHPGLNIGIKNLKILLRVLPKRQSRPGQKPQDAGKLLFLMESR
jgi:hypothetical protein